MQLDWLNYEYHDIIPNLKKLGQPSYVLKHLALDIYLYACSSSLLSFEIRKKIEKLQVPTQRCYSIVVENQSKIKVLLLCTRIRAVCFPVGVEMVLKHAYEN